MPTHTITRTAPEPVAKKKKPKPEITEDGMKFDSMEELYFYWWAKDLQSVGLVTSITRGPMYYLADPVKIPVVNAKGKTVSKSIMREASYTPDFLLCWNVAHPALPMIGRNVFKNHREERQILLTSDWESVIEVKPLMAGRDGKGNAQKAISQVYRKWTMQRHKTFVQLVIIGNGPKSWFEETFTPKRFLLTDKTLSRRKLNYTARSMAEWLKSLS